MNQKTKPIESQKMMSVELSAMKIRQINEQPAVQSSVNVSKDGKWLIHKTTITDIKPVSYFEKVLDSIDKE